MAIEQSTSDVWEMKSIKIESLNGLLTRKIIDFEETSTKVEEAILGRIPDIIRANHEKEYEPVIIAIGPYHRSIDSQEKEINPRLKPMEDMKLQFLSDLCKRVAKAKNMAKEDVLGNITDVIQEHKDEARKKYSQPLLRMMCSEDFVQMLVLDGCFIVELLLKWNHPYEFNALSMTFKGNILHSVFRDLLLYENQIPFFILEEIHGTCFPTTATDMSNLQSIRNLAIKFFVVEEEFRDQNIHHLLHLYHKNMVGEQNPIAEDNDEVKDPENCTTIFYNVIKPIFNSVVMFMTFIVVSPALLVFGFLLLIWSWWNYCWNTNKYVAPMKIKNIPTATRLAEHGVQFRRKEIVGSASLVDVSFEDGIMEIPHMNIEDDTSSEYRNLLALEQSCKRVYGNKFTSYVIFIDDLIDTTDYVALLKKNDILNNCLGSDENVAKIFNEMNHGLNHDPRYHYLVRTNEKIKEYYGKIYNKWWGTLMRDYFSSLWTIISVLAVSSVIYLTAVQTVCSIIQVI